MKSIERFKTLQRMRTQVKEELKDIPRGSFAQNMLRFVYWDMRMHSLGIKTEKPKTRAEIFRQAVEHIKREHPDFEPKCEGYFKKTYNRKQEEK